MPKVLVIFSFALCPDEPAPCNIRLAKAVERIIKEEKEKIIIVAQWEVALQLVKDGIHVDHTVNLLPDKSYLGSEEVWIDAMNYLNSNKINNISKVIPVAHPYLHMYKVKKLIENSGFITENHKMGYIGFDKNSTQWWTRGPLRLLIYSIFQLFGLHGHFGKQKYDLDLSKKK